MPFRQAHEVVGQAVRQALDRTCGLKDLPLAEYRKLSPLIGNDVYRSLSVDASVSRRTSYGGTAQTNVRKRLATLKKLVK